MIPFILFFLLILYRCSIEPQIKDNDHKGY